MVVAWLVLGVILLAFELRHLAFYALFAAVGLLRRLRHRRCSCPIDPASGGGGRRRRRRSASSPSAR